MPSEDFALCLLDPAKSREHQDFTAVFISIFLYLPSDGFDFAARAYCKPLLVTQMHASKVGDRSYFLA